MWELARSFVAIEGNLARHHVPCSSWCFLCGYTDAKTIHVFFFFPAARSIWKQQLWYHIKHLGGLDVQNLLIWIADNKIVELEKIAMLCWGFWQERCSIKHDTSRSGKRGISVEWAM